MMDQYLAGLYETPGHEEELEKAAQAEVFVKLAVDQGIDINQLTDDQVAELWTATFDDEDAEEEKIAAANDELVAAAHEEFQGFSSVAEMDKQAEDMGKRMAHSFYAELQEIEKASSRSGGVSQNLSGTVSDKTRNQKLDKGFAAGQADRASGPTPVNRSSGPSGGSSETLAKGVGEKPGQKKPSYGPKDTTTLRTRATIARQNLRTRATIARQNASKRVRAAGDSIAKTWKGSKKGKAGLIAAGLGTAAALGGAGYGASKAASAIDQLAGELAFQKVAEDDWDQDEAADRLNAVLILGAGESEKIAYANNTEEAVEIRSLELLELAGYPVEWSE